MWRLSGWTDDSLIRVVDDHSATRTGLAALIDAHPDMAAVGQAADGEEGLRLVAALQPEVALIDLRLPKLGGSRPLPG